MTTDADLLEETLATIFDDHLGPEARRAGSQEPPPELWRALDQAGVTALGDPTSGAGVTDLVAVARAVGRAAAPVPLVEMSGLASWIAGRSGLAMPAGVVTVGGMESGERLAVVPADGEWAVTGEVERVPWGRSADAVVAIAESPSGPRVVVLGPPDDITVGHSLAGEPRDTLAWHGRRVTSDAVSDETADTERYLHRAALLRSAAMAGAIERLSEMTLAHAQQREQFGRPIARFQAVQAHLVAIAEESVCATMAVDTAVLAPEPEAGPLCAVAKVTAGRAAERAAACAHQVHGAIGTTEEHLLHWYTTRLWSWQDEAGTAEWWAERLGADVLRRGHESLWPMLTSPHMERHGVPV